MKKHNHFPLFVETQNKLVLVVGGGKIALRRIKTLCKFDLKILVIAKEAVDEIKLLAKNNSITLHEREFVIADIDGAFMVVCTTNDRKLNHTIGNLAKSLGLFVSVADCKDECNFFFPAIAENGSTIIGIVGDGNNHHEVSKIAKKIRGFYEN